VSAASLTDEREGNQVHSLTRPGSLPFHLQDKQVRQHMFTELHTQLTHWLTQTHDTVLARDLQPLLVTGRDVDLLGALALLDLHELLTPTERAAFNQSMAKGELPSLPKKAPELWLETHPEARDVAMALTRDYLTALLDDLEVLEPGNLPFRWPAMCERREQAAALSRLLGEPFKELLEQIDAQGARWAKQAHSILFEGSEMLQRAGFALPGVWWVQNLLIYNT